MTSEFDRNIMDLVNLLNSNRERGCDVVEHALQLLDRTLMPSTPFNLDNPNVKDAVEGAFTGLVLLARIFRCFKLKSSHMRPLEDMCLPRIIEWWADLTSWVVAIITDAGQAMNPHAILSLCAEAVEGVIYNADDNPGKCELVSLPVTADVICTLLAQTPKSIKSYFYILGPSDECMIIELFWAFASTQNGCQSFILAFNSYDSKMKRRVVDSLTIRFGQLGTDPKKDDPHHIGPSFAKSLCHLIQGLALVLQDDEIFRRLLRHDFIGLCAYALDTLAGRGVTSPSHAVEFWEFLSEATICFFQDIILKRAKSPYLELTQALKDGFLQCAQQCLLNVKSKEMQERLLCGVFAEVCNYYTCQDVLFGGALKIERDLATKVEKRYPPKLYPMIGSLSRCIVDCCASLKEGTELLVNLCSNLNVRCYQILLALVSPELIWNIIAALPGAS
ncbi:hypothetical protein EST38_g10191 [Candolleomyces aberdarensis]|uniref:Uncharacterized protein n=1 Tax=Candolleomyces aberdarensis TaxID=2316362 RepID=A0A4Q2D9Q2_9AGAR|nr:hypothetical protein EST38_g10191 [Candolleomyces aberdarensis]